MTNLTTDSTITYNGVVFDVTTETLELSGRPQYDSAGRTVIFTAWTLTLRGIVTPEFVGQTTDATLASMRRLLSVPGGAFRYEDTGFGSFTVNTPKPAAGIVGGAIAAAMTVWDAAWGPKPDLISWKPIGHSAAAEVTWRVTVSIPEMCVNPTYRLGVLSFNYSLRFSVDRSGYQSRIYTGKVAIPQTRLGVNVRRLQDSADRLRESIIPALIPGFRRIPGEFNLSEDKCSLTFTVTDEQLPPQPLPEFVVEASAEHSIESEPRNLFQYVGNIAATYEVARGKSRTLAWDAFSVLWRDRLDRAKKNGTSVFPVKLTMREPEIYGRKAASFNLTYYFTVQTPEKVLRAGGLWRPVPGASFDVWQRSMVTAKVFGPRGNAGLKFNFEDDAIIDLCAAGLTPPLKTLGDLEIKPPLEDVSVKGLAVELPPPDQSWLDYQIELSVEVIDETVEIKLLPDKEPGYEPRAASTTDTAGFKLPYPSRNCSVIQRRSGPRVALWLTGRALRAGYEINPPQLVQALGQQPEPGNRRGCGFFTTIAGNWGIPIASAVWNFRYILPCIPTSSTVQSPPNPVIGEITRGGDRSIQGFVIKPL